MHLDESKLDNIINGYITHVLAEDTPYANREFIQNPRMVAVSAAAQKIFDVLLEGMSRKHHCAKAQAIAIRDKMRSIEQILYPQIRSAAAYLIREDRSLSASLDSFARDATEKFLGGFKSASEILRTDLEAAFNSDPAARFREEINVYPFVKAIATHRVAHNLYNLNVPIVPRMLSEWAHTQSNIDLHPGAKIGESFFADHADGVVFGETAIVGKGVKAYQGASLVAKSLAEGRNLRNKKRHPTIEDYVTLYAGCCILGGNTVVGHHSTIGANVHLPHSVPPRTVVVAENKFIIKSHEGSDPHNRLNGNWPH